MRVVHLVNYYNYQFKSWTAVKPFRGKQQFLFFITENKERINKNKQLQSNLFYCHQMSLKEKRKNKTNFMSNREQVHGVGITETKNCSQNEIHFFLRYPTVGQWQLIRDVGETDYKPD